MHINHKKNFVLISCLCVISGLIIGADGFEERITSLSGRKSDTSMRSQEYTRRYRLQHDTPSVGVRHNQLDIEHHDISSDNDISSPEDRVLSDHDLSDRDNAHQDVSFDVSSHDMVQENGGRLQIDLSADLYQRKIDTLFDEWNKDLQELRRNLQRKGAGWQDFWETDESQFVEDLTRIFDLKDVDAQRLADATEEYIRQAVSQGVSDVEMMSNIKEMYSIMFGVKGVPASSDHLQDVFKVMKRSFIETLPGIIKEQILEDGKFNDLFGDMRFNTDELDKLRITDDIQEFVDVVNRSLVRNFVDDVDNKILVPSWKGQDISEDLAKRLSALLKEHLLDSSNVAEIDAKMQELYPYLELRNINDLHTPVPIVISAPLAEALKQYQLEIVDNFVKNKLKTLNISKQQVDELSRVMQNDMASGVRKETNPQNVLQGIQDILRQINALSADQLRQSLQSLKNTESSRSLQALKVALKVAAVGAVAYGFVRWSSRHS